MNYGFSVFILPNHCDHINICGKAKEPVLSNYPTSDRKPQQLIHQLPQLMHPQKEKIVLSGAVLTLI